MITTSIYREYWEEPTSKYQRSPEGRAEVLRYVEMVLGNVPYPPAFKRESPLSE